MSNGFNALLVAHIDIVTAMANYSFFVSFIITFQEVFLTHV